MEATCASQPQADQHEPHAKYVSAGGLLLWTTAALVIYLISIGPVAKLCYESDMPTKFPRIERALELFYSPIEICAKHSQAFRLFFDWYVFDVWHIHLK
jgi:hypothetical protein